MSTEMIRIDGLRQLVRDLKKVDRNLGKAVRIAGNQAAEGVVGDAKSAIPVGPPRGGHAKNSVKAKSTQTSIRVSAGGTKYPYYPWLDFGGAVGKNDSVRRPFIKKGRYLWSSFSGRREEVIRLYQDALKDIIEQSGIEVD